jgi:outer membrane protein OmpA-like peptidoglycan-associated protein
VGINYGGGIKWHFTDHFGLRIDARGFWSRNPTYDLPNYPDGGIYIPAKDKLNSFQGTVGLVWYLGEGKCPPMPPAPPPPAPLPTPTITGGQGTTICQGKPVTLHANIQGPAGHNLAYAWTLNGAAQQATGPDFTFTPNNTGSFSVQVSITDTTPPPPPMERPKKFPERCWVQPPTPPPPAPAVATTTINVPEVSPTINNVSASPNALTCQKDGGPGTAQLTASVTPSPCGGNLTYKWTVSEGSVTGDNTPNATFDASTLSFDPNSATDQSKTVTATVTVTDETGKTASQSTQITVTCKGNPIVRLDDVVFAKNNARVNNCGKRLLIDDAARRMASGDYDIVLVGHRTADEQAEVAGRRGRGRHREPGRPLDEVRALNCAAVLTGGGGTCANVDPTHVKVDWVGTDQTSEPRPGQCVTSNIKERRGSAVTNADQNRRVEIYLVPRNAQTMPPAVKNVKPLPESEVKALGCPK